jgi:dTMP kinase
MPDIGGKGSSSDENPYIRNNPKVTAMSGILIAVEGIDGSGKSTVAGYIAGRLEEQGIPCVLLREPSESVYGKRLREMKWLLSAEDELELFTRDREVDVRERILPALRDGKVVIMDRYYLSSIAYQGARGIDPEMIRERNESFAPKPDLVLLLDLPVDVAMERIRKRKGSTTPFENRKLLGKVRELFLKYADEKTVVIDAERPLEVVLKEVEEAVMSFMSMRCMHECSCRSRA